MYIEEGLARERQTERLKQAHDQRVANRIVELGKMEKRKDRAERELLYTWRRMDQLRAVLRGD